MTPDALIPGRIVTAVAMVTVFALMLELGTLVEVRAFRAAWREPWLMAKAIFCAFVAVPLVALVVARAFGLSREAQIGIVLMAIAPGAPVALRRALRAGGDVGFAVSLQATFALLCIVTMPLSVAALDQVFAGEAGVDPRALALQVVAGQGAPLALGLAARRAAPATVERYAAWLDRTAGALMLVLVAMALTDVWRPVWQAGARAAVAIAVVVACAVAMGHALGGPRPAMRTVLGVACGARNVGLALLVATLNHASDAITATILAYLVFAAIVITPYVAWRRRRARVPQNTSLA